MVYPYSSLLIQQYLFYHFNVFMNFLAEWSKYFSLFSLSWSFHIHQKTQFIFFFMTSVHFNSTECAMHPFLQIEYLGILVFLNFINVGLLYSYLKYLDLFRWFKWEEEYNGIWNVLQSRAVTKIQAHFE